MFYTENAIVIDGKEQIDIDDKIYKGKTYSKDYSLYEIIKELMEFTEDFNKYCRQNKVALVLYSTSPLGKGHDYIVAEVINGKISALNPCHFKDLDNPEYDLRYSDDYIPDSDEEEPLVLM